MLYIIPEKHKNSTNRLWNKWFIEIQRRCVKAFINVGKLGLEVENQEWSREGYTKGTENIV